MGEIASKHNPSSDENLYRFVHLDEETVNRLIDADMTAAEYRLFLLLSLVDPFGNRPINTSGRFLRERLGISKATYHRSIATIVEQELFDLEDTVLRVRSKVGSKSPERIVSKMRPPSQKRDPSLKNETAVSEMRIAEAEISSTEGFQDPSIDLRKDQYLPVEKEREETAATNQEEGRTEKASSSIDPPPQPVKNRPLRLSSAPSDWTEFSAPGSDVGFFDFVVRRAAKFQNPPPVDVKCTAEGWIRKQGHILWPEYLAWVEGQNRPQWQAIAENIAVVLPTPPILSAAEQRAAALARLKVKYQNLRLRKAAIAECEQWGFVIGAAGPEDCSSADP